MVSFPSIPRNVNLTVDSGGANCYDDIVWKQCGSPTSTNSGNGVPFFELKGTSLIAVTSIDFMNFRLKIFQVVLNIDTGKGATEDSHAFILSRYQASYAEFLFSSLSKFSSVREPT